MRNEYVSVSFGNSRDITVSPIYQYDHGLVLRISDVRPEQIQQAHYAVEGQDETTGLQLISQDGALEARIPDNLVAQGKTVIAYLYFEDDNAGYTVKTIKIPVIPREKPGTVLMDAPDSSKVGQLVDDLDNLIAQATGAVQTATDAANAAKGTSQQAKDLMDETAAQLQDLQTATDNANTAAQAATDAVGQVDSKVQEMETAVNKAKAEAEEAKAAAEAAKKAAEEAGSDVDLTEVYEALDKKADINALDDKADVSALDNKVDKETGKGLSTNDYTTAEKRKLAGIEAEANHYVHPAHQAYESGFYKVQVDDLGHVTGAVPVTAEDINALGIEPAPPATYHEVQLPVDGWTDGARDVPIEQATVNSKVVVLETDEYALTSDLYWQASDGKVTFMTNTTPWSDVPVKFLLMQTPEGD